MTKSEWTRSIILKIASGHLNGPTREEAKDWLQGKDPPDYWEPKAKKEFEKRKNDKADS